MEDSAVVGGETSALGQERMPLMMTMTYLVPVLRPAPSRRIQSSTNVTLQSCLTSDSHCKAEAQRSPAEERI